ncbi:helix-loop-helix protein 2 [Platysternon megacephalum]|uniref:Helix-loop-helix protein 2 n=1 Tax=Platysternon megacephalum TaxID=55544 RepID=A0A4D9EBT2_9SAUR|nr:helix-loop-helix protein 2 [Platysternon megacephalum]
MWPRADPALALWSWHPTPAHRSLVCVRGWGPHGTPAVAESWLSWDTLCWVQVLELPTPPTPGVPTGSSAPPWLQPAQAPFPGAGKVSGWSVGLCSLGLSDPM